MGCVSGALKVAAVLVALVVGVAAWVYRGEIRDVAIQVFRPGPAPSEGRPGIRALASAKDKVATLEDAMADSVILSASEMASLVGDGLDPSFRGNLDSLQIQLLEGRIAVSANLRIEAIPRESLGPLAFIVQDWEPFSAVGPIRVVGPTQAEWGIEELSLRDIPFPSEMIQWLVSTTLGGTADGGFLVHIPEGIHDAAIHPHGVVLYGNRQ